MANECKFERVLRECGHNKELTGKGITRGLLYDFKVILDGQHVAWWYQYSPNGRTDTMGFRYWLKDKTWGNISNGLSNRHGHPVAARNREEFERVLIANLHRIPTDEQLADRKLDQERKEEKKKADEDAAQRLRQMELAAPELLDALKAMLLSFYESEEGLCLKCGEGVGTGAGCESCLVFEKANQAIAKAEGK